MTVTGARSQQSAIHGGIMTTRRPMPAHFVVVALLCGVRLTTRLEHGIMRNVPMLDVKYLEGLGLLRIWPSKNGILVGFGKHWG